MIIENYYISNIKNYNNLSIDYILSNISVFVYEEINDNAISNIHKEASSLKEEDILCISEDFVNGPIHYIRYNLTDKGKEYIISLHELEQL